MWKLAVLLGFLVLFDGINFIRILLADKLESCTFYYQLLIDRV